MIRVENLVKTFGEFTAVDHISFEVGKGEIFAFLGPNGAGKTTTIKMLTTLLRPTSGALEVDGLDPARHSNEVRKRFGIVFQDPSLDGDMTAYENMEIHGIFYHVPRKLRLERIEYLLRLFELWERRGEQVTVFLTTHYMDEAERVAQRMAIIDHGKIVAQGSPQELKQQTGKDSLEEAFLSLTGSTIRDEASTSADQMRQMAKMWSGRR